eukprot:129565-Rhodomonas_salina.1
MMKWHRSTGSDAVRTDGEAKPNTPTHIHIKLPSCRGLERREVEGRPLTGVQRVSRRNSGTTRNLNCRRAFASASENLTVCAAAQAKQAKRSNAGRVRTREHAERVMRAEDHSGVCEEVKLGACWENGGLRRDIGSRQKRLGLLRRDAAGKECACFTPPAAWDDSLHVLARTNLQSAGPRCPGGCILRAPRPAFPLPQRKFSAHSQSHLTI